MNTQPISDAATIVRPVNLRNLPPDHLLVLVNGKRRHRGAMIAWLGNGLSDGAQGPDLSSIPSIAIRQAELLRDGAAAQYGSDAIAGVLNFQLKDARRGGSVSISTGSHLTPNVGNRSGCEAAVAPGGYAHSCDAIGGRAGAYSFAGNVGLPVGESGFANLSLEYGGSDPTNRAVQRTDAQNLLDVGNTSVRDTAQVWGVPRVSDDVKAFANLGFQAGLYRPYLHANYARREVLGGFYYRHPYSRGGVFRGPEIDGGPSLLVGDRLLAESGGLSSAGCPGIPIVDGLPDSVALAAVEANPDCFTLFSRFPGGFTPQFGGTLFDGSTVAGVPYLRPDGFGWDLSAGVGRSRVHQLLTNSVNASLGPDTPTTFRPGMAEQTEVNVNFDVTVPLDAGFHLATGAEWRQEAFRLGAGERASWEIGPYAAQGFSSGSNGFNGYRPDTAAGRWARANIAAYADLEHRDDDGRWTLAAALRAEHFADFGRDPERQGRRPPGPSGLVRPARRGLDGVPCADPRPAELLQRDHRLHRRGAREPWRRPVDVVGRAIARRRTAAARALDALQPGARPPGAEHVLLRGRVLGRRLRPPRALAGDLALALRGRRAAGGGHSGSS